MGETDCRKPIALFMAFGTKGDVYPLAAIAAAFASDQQRYRVVLMSHSAHENMTCHLTKTNVSYFPVSSPPSLSSQAEGTLDDADLSRIKFLLEKQKIKKEHKRECHSAFRSIFGDGPSMEGDFVVINFFALEGWSLAELFQIRCMVAAPYFIPYSQPSAFEPRFRKDLPDLYKYLREAPPNMVSWTDVIHWMWPLFTEEWGSWRYEELNLSCYPFTDPVTDLPIWHTWSPSPLLLYGFSKEIVECPDYWPPNVRVCGFWFLPNEWQFSCDKCKDIPSWPTRQRVSDDSFACSTHFGLYSFIQSAEATPLIFIGLSSVGSMGFLRCPQAFLRVLQAVILITDYKFVLFTAGYEPLDATILTVAADSASSKKQPCRVGISIFGGKLFCFSGMVPYKLLFQRCAASIHHGGSGTTAAALHAGIPQIICPFMLDQFYWAEKMTWIGVAPEPLKRHNLIPEKTDDESIIDAAQAVTRAIHEALSPKVRERALEIAEKISLEDGVSEAVRVLREEVCDNKGSNCRFR